MLEGGQLSCSADRNSSIDTILLPVTLSIQFLAHQPLLASCFQVHLKLDRALRPPSKLCQLKGFPPHSRRAATVSRPFPQRSANLDTRLSSLMPWSSSLTRSLLTKSEHGYRCAPPDLAPPAFRHRRCLFEVNKLVNLCRHLMHEELEFSEPGPLIGIELHQDINTGMAIFIGPVTIPERQFKAVQSAILHASHTQMAALTRIPLAGIKASSSTEFWTAWAILGT